MKKRARSKTGGIVERRGTIWRNIGIAPGMYRGPAVSDLSTETVPVHLQGTSVNDITLGSAFDGDWDTTIATPVGKLAVKLHIATVNGIIQGTAAQGEEVSTFVDPDLQGSRLHWSLRIKKPMRLNLKFEAEVDGSVMTGIAKAGVLPASKLTGKRR